MNYNICKHGRNKEFCCECNYGKLTILCEYNHKNKCELTGEKCEFKIEDRWLCDNFIEKGTIDREIDIENEDNYD